MSSDSLVGLIQHCATVCQISIKNVEGAYRLGKIALKIMRRFDLPELTGTLYFCHYGFVANHVEPIQSCSQMLRKAFEGMYFIFEESPCDRFVKDWPC